MMDNKRVIFRSAKITPTKIGQFVTFWKRIGSGPIMPYDFADPFDFLIVSVRNGHNLGQFVFSKEVLLAHKIISKDGIDGKRALRVYPPWDMAENPQALKSQAWQINYFFAIEPEVDAKKMKKLFG